MSILPQSSTARTPQVTPSPPAQPVDAPSSPKAFWGSPLPPESTQTANENNSDSPPLYKPPPSPVSLRMESKKQILKTPKRFTLSPDSAVTSLVPKKSIKDDPDAPILYQERAIFIFKGLTNDKRFKNGIDLGAACQVFATAWELNEVNGRILPSRIIQHFRKVLSKRPKGMARGSSSSSKKKSRKKKKKKKKSKKSKQIKIDSPISHDIQTPSQKTNEKKQTEIIGIEIETMSANATENETENEPSVSFSVSVSNTADLLGILSDGDLNESSDYPDISLPPQ